MLRRKSNPDALRERLQSDERLVGTFLKLPALESVEIAASVGFDFVIVDLEHSQLSLDQARQLVRHASSLDLPAIVRVPSIDPGEVNRLLEAGGAGIQLSTVTAVADVRGLVSATRYPPEGRRSVSVAHPAAGFGASPLDEAVRVRPLLVGQIETAETADPLPDILSAGLDVAFLGSTDLLVDVGFDRGRHSARIEEVNRTAEAVGIAFGIFSAAPAEVPPSARYVALSTDVSILRRAALDLVAEAKAAASPPSEGPRDPGHIRSTQPQDAPVLRTST